MHPRAWIYVVITCSLYLQKCVCDVYMCGWGGGGGMLEMSNVSWAEWKREKKKRRKKNVYLLVFPTTLFFYTCTHCSFESCFCVGGTFIIF